MSRLFVIFLLFIALAAFSYDAKTQTKKRIGLPEGADSVQVKGKITGKQYALYEIYVSKGEKWDVKLTSRNVYIGYTVKDAKGNRYDFLEAAPVSGYYLIRVELNSNGTKSKQIATFTLDIKFEMEQGKPISE